MVTRPRGSVGQASKALSAFAAVLAFLFAACGSDKKANEASSSVTTETTATTVASAGDQATFCRVLDKINVLFNSIPDPTGTSPETVNAFVAVSKQILALRDETLAAAPSGIDDEVTVFFGAVEKVANAVDPTAASINATYETSEQHAATQTLSDSCPQAP